MAAGNSLVTGLTIDEYRTDNTEFYGKLAIIVGTLILLLFIMLTIFYYINRKLNERVKERTLALDDSNSHLELHVKILKKK
ncbi:MAG: CHASE3 domain sensor protein [Colwellia sp.]|jgi:CHASE3 domain sensor protein